MKNIYYSFVLLVAVLFSQAAISQTEQQPLIVPEMEKHDLYNAPARNNRPGITGRSVAMPTVRISRIDITAGSTTPDHNHPDEELVLVLEGSVKAKMGDKEFIINPGELFTIPAYVQHSYEALEDSVTIEVFGPGRSAGGGGAMGGGAMGAGAMAP